MIVVAVTASDVSAAVFVAVVNGDVIFVAAATIEKLGIEVDAVVFAVVVVVVVDDDDDEDSILISSSVKSIFS